LHGPIGYTLFILLLRSVIAILLSHLQPTVPGSPFSFDLAILTIRSDSLQLQGLDELGKILVYKPYNKPVKVGGANT
jgi:hypothetical protein